MPQPGVPSSMPFRKTQEAAIGTLLGRKKQFIIPRDRGHRRTVVVEGRACRCRLEVKSGDGHSVWS